MRLPYAPNVPGPAAYAQLSTRQSPNPLQALDLTLCHSPLITSGWSLFLGAIRIQTSIPAAIHKLRICRVAVLNGADYEWEHHVPILFSEGGVSENIVKEIRQRKAWRGWQQDEEGELNLSEQYRAVWTYTDAMTVGIKISDEIFAGLRKLFEEREIVEITATVTAYNCVSWFLVALDVGKTSEKEDLSQ